MNEGFACYENMQLIYQNFVNSKLSIFAVIYTSLSTQKVEYVLVYATTRVFFVSF